MLTSLVSWQHGYVKKSKKSTKVVNIEGKNIHIFWTTWGISTKFSGKMWLMIILKVSKNPGFTLSLKHIFEKATGNGGRIDLLSRFRVNPFVPNGRFLYTLKTSENRKVFWSFQGVEKGSIGKEWDKINESQYIVLFADSGSIKKLSSIDYVNFYLFLIFFSIAFARWRSVGLPHIAYH